MTEVTNVPRPYIKSWRESLLRRLLETQAIVRAKAPDEMKTIELISLAALSEIRRIWLEEKHEFDDALPQIYAAVTGDPFQDLRPTGESLLKKAAKAGDVKTVKQLTVDAAAPENQSSPS